MKLESYFSVLTATVASGLTLAYKEQLILPTIVALSTLASTLFVRGAMQRSDFSQGTLQVKGSTEKEVISDFATLQGTISVTTRYLAHTELERKITALRSYFKENKISEEATTYFPIVTHLHPQEDSVTLTQNFSIASTDIKTISLIALQITPQLFKENIDISLQAPQYFYLKIEELKSDLLKIAAVDAKRCAVALLETENRRVGALRSARQGIFQMAPVGSNSLSDDKENDTSSIRKKIKATVTMEYDIN